MGDNRESEGGFYKIPAEFGFIGLYRPFFFILLLIPFVVGCSKDEEKKNFEVNPLKVAGIDEVFPSNLEDSVVVNPIVSVTFKPGTDPNNILSSILTLKKVSGSVPGKTIISGTTAIFTPVDDLMPDTEYTATITTCKKSGSNYPETYEYSWIFRTGKQHYKSTLSVISTGPLDNAISVPVDTLLTVTFNQELTAIMRKSTSIILKTGQSSVDGSFYFSDSAAIFKPSKNLTPKTVYTGKVQTAIGYHDEDDKSGNSFYWSFTTRD
jgi:hypothetical protein